MEKSEGELPKEKASYFSSFLNRIGGVFLAPDATFKQIITEKIGFLEPFAIVLVLVGIEGLLIASFVHRIISAVIVSFGSLLGDVSLGFLSIVWLAIAIGMVVVTLILWIIVAGIAHISVKYIFKSSGGSFVQLMKLYGYTLVPFSLVILGTFLFEISWATWLFFVFFAVVAVFWIALLMAVAVKHTYNIDIGKAFISSFIGPMVVCLILAWIFWLWMWLTITSFSGGIV